MGSAVMRVQAGHLWVGASPFMGWGAPGGHHVLPAHRKNASLCLQHLSWPGTLQLCLQAITECQITHKTPMCGVFLVLLFFNLSLRPPWWHPLPLPQLCSPW